MSQVNERDLDAIKEWLAKEPSLPNTFDDHVLEKFIYSCDCSLERTKKCIEEFCTRRVNMPEIYTNRDPLSKRIQSVYSYTTVTTYSAGEDEVLIHQLKYVPSSFDFYDALKGFTMQADEWINLKLDVMFKNQVVVMDIKMYTLALVAKSNVFYFQKFLLYLIESLPVRLKNVHVINCPSYYEYLYNLVKGALPENVINMVHFHPTHMGLHKFIDIKYLPEDYGGLNKSIEEQNDFFVEMISDKRKSFLNDDYWKANLSKKVKTAGDVDNAMNGSFRTLSID